MPEASFSYYLVKWFFVLVKNIFFRDVIVRGSHKIPEKGAVVFVAAPHCNQFVDPIILISCSPRPIGFLMAAISLKRRIIGVFGRMLGSIPVDRAQDHAKKCTGRIFLLQDDETNLKLNGEETFFSKEVAKYLSEFNNQAAIILSYEKEYFCAAIELILNDYELILKKPFDQKINSLLKSKKVTFSVVPLINQRDLYTSVFDKFTKQECIGIFPEGGSHDRAEMLPLKAGVTIMSLGYLSLYPDASLKIVPCGLNYFNADRFRSRAVIDFGDPLDVPKELVEDFKSGGETKKQAIVKHLQSIAAALQAVTVNVPDLETLQVVQAARRLYCPEETYKKPDLQLELNRRFVKGYLKYRTDTRIIQLRQSIFDYNNLLLAFGIKDNQVKNTQINTIKSICQLLFHLSVLIIFGIVSLPGFVLNLPALYFIGRISKIKAKAALKASNIKIHGKDVISTWKILVALVLLPVMYGMYALGILLSFHFTSPFTLFFIFVTLFHLLALFSFITVRISEMFLDSYNSVKPLILAVLNPKRCYILRQVRTSLRDQINFVVNELGPTVVDNFEQNRIIESCDNFNVSGNTSLFSTSELIFQSDSNLIFSNISNYGDLKSGRTSPIYDTNMESIGNMLCQCKEMFNYKKKKL